ncbi:MAG: type III-A CRISPR-associated protein Cas10/Csm1 [Ignavibacteriaceae bacterium]
MSNNKNEIRDDYNFPSIFCKIKNKPNEDKYPKTLAFNNFNTSKISYPIKSSSEKVGEYPEAAGINTAIENCLKFKENSENPFLLVSGDLSGIQDTVYTISSKGALKSLRARSFMLEFLCEHVCYEIITNCLGDYNVYRNHVIFSGGGSFCIILPNISLAIDNIKIIKEVVNEWAFEEFSAKLFVAISYVELNSEDVSIKDDNSLRNKWNVLSDKLEIEKKRKFNWKLNNLFDENTLEEPQQKSNKEECQICHRDDIIISKNNPFYDLHDFKSSPIFSYTEIRSKADETDWIHDQCYQLLKIGDDLIDARFIIRLKDEPQLENYYKGGYLKLPSINSYVFYVVKKEKAGINCQSIWEINGNGIKVPAFYYSNYVTSNIDLREDVKSKAFTKYKNGIKNIDQTEAEILNKFNSYTADFESLADSSCGAGLISCLRMDVDNMGKILTQDLEVFNLVTLANFSKMLNLFFKVYLKNICAGNLGLINGRFIPPTNIISKDYSQGRKISIIYSGGDDLFIVGAWDEVAELGYDIQKCFKEYSGLGISAGLTLHKPGFPLYQMAKQSAEALNESKSFKYFYDIKPTKNKYSLFYKSSKKHKSLELNYIAIQNLRNEKEDSLDKLYSSLGWDDDSILKIISQFKEMCVVDKDRLILQGISNSFIRKLFRVLETWWGRNIFYVPDLLRLFNERINKISTTTPLKYNLANFRDMLIKMPLQNNPHRAIRTLLIPLTWIELLQREKGK